MGQAKGLPPRGARRSLSDIKPSLQGFRGLPLVDCWQAGRGCEVGAGTPSRTMTGKIRSLFFSYSEPVAATML
jgi:hypothetical protein